MRCFISPDDWNRERVALDAEESHHLLRVLRARAGDEVDVFNGEGGIGRARVASVDRSRATLEITRRDAAPPPAAEITLVQALPREQKMDFIIQKATELGAACVAPLATERAVVHVGGGRAGDKKARWEKIALNAAKQCGAARLPRILAPCPLGEYLDRRPASDLFLVCALDPAARPLREVLAEARPRPVRSVAVLVGPEGDFSVDELQSILAAGARPVSLGGGVLRSETAAIYVLSVLRYELGL